MMTLAHQSNEKKDTSFSLKNGLTRKKVPTVGMV